MATFVVLALVVIVVGWGIMAYNRLIALKNRVANAWKQIDVQLKRRHDLIPNLVDTVRGAMQFERETLDAVISARNKALTVERGGASVSQTAAVESQLSGALGRLCRSLSGSQGYR
jgi:LemA protein